jgi:hypothetical protein
VSRPGCCPLRSHTQRTTRSAPEYSSSSATATERCCTAMK